MGLLVAIPVLVGWIPLWRQDRLPTWYLAPTLAALAFGLWAEPIEGAIAASAGVVPARAVSRLLLLVLLPLALLWIFGEGNLVPGWPALGLGRRGLGRSLGYGLVAGLVLVPLAWFALSGRGAGGLVADQAPFLVLEAVSEEVFFRGILLLPLVPNIGRAWAAGIAGSSFLLTRSGLFVTVNPLTLVPSPVFALTVLTLTVAFVLVSLRTKNVAGACLGRSLVRVVPSLLL